MPANVIAIDRPPGGKASPRRVERGADVALPLALAIFVTACVLGGGLPALRHDWRIPAQPDALRPWLEGFFQPWTADGIGRPQPYPTFYLVGFVLWPLHFVLDAFGITVLIVASAMALAARAAMRVAVALGGGTATASAAALLVCLNPWVYAKYVAGHVLMVLAYAIVLALLAEIVRPEPRTWALTLLGAFSITQIEFFAVALPPLAAWALASKRHRVLIAAGLAAAPLAFGIVTSYGSIGATPFNLSWQESQSLRFTDALLLQGYAADYAHAFAPFAPVTVLVIAAALAGAPAVARERGPAFAVALIGAGALLFSTGTKGPLGPLYRLAVIARPELGLFRELYDLIALVVIAYLVLACRGLARRRRLAPWFALALCAYAAPWLLVPPARFFVPARELPSPVFPRDDGSRIALLPAFQPLQYQGRGSGVDPDAYPRDSGSQPVNDFFPAFPLDAALGASAFRGDDRALSALGVGRVIARPYLDSDRRSLRHQWIGPANSPLPSFANRHVASAPLLALVPDPLAATIGDGPGEDAVFFGDTDPHAIRAFEPTRATADPGAAWVDARLGVPIRPQWGSAFGGVATTGSEPLRVPLSAAGTSLLAQTDGSLIDDAGRTVATATPELHWWALRAGVRAVRCRGTCIVVLQGRVPAGLPEHRPLPAAAYVALPLTFVTPWFARAQLPAAARGTLRLAVRYAPGWSAFAGGVLLPHVRLDTALNAWHIAAAGPQPLVFVQRTVAFELALEVFATLAILALLLADTALYYTR